MRKVVYGRPYQHNPATNQCFNTSTLSLSAQYPEWFTWHCRRLPTSRHTRDCTQQRTLVWVARLPTGREPTSWPVRLSGSSQWRRLCGDLRTLAKLARPPADRAAAAVIHRQRGKGNRRTCPSSREAACRGGRRRIEARAGVPSVPTSPSGWHRRSD